MHWPRIETLTMNKKAERKLGRLFEAFGKASETGDAEKAEEIGLRVFATLGEVKDEPSDDLKLKMEAHRHEEAGDLAMAEDAYRRCLALAQRDGEEWSIFKAHHDLSRLFSFMGREPEAREEANLALVSARKTGMDVLIGTALESAAGDALRAGDYQAALEHAEELLSIAQGSRMHDLQRARGLCIRASALIWQDRFYEAEADLDAAWRILGPHSKPSLFAGYQSSLSHWWRLTAAVRKKRNDPEGAIEAMRRHVEYARNVSAAPQLEGPYKYNGLAKALFEFGKVLREAGRTDEAEAAFTESRNLRELIWLAPLE